MSSRQFDRRSQHKKTVGHEDGRRRREDISISIRKNKREEGLAKRRQTSEEAVPLQNTMTASSGMRSHAFTVADIPTLWANIQSSDPQIRLDAVKGFRKVLSHEKNPPVREVIDTGVLPILIQLLQSVDSPELQFEAAWALTNIASTDMTRIVVEAGVVPIMAQLLLSQSPDVREQCAWCLSNIAGDCAELRDFVIQSGAMQPLLQNVIQPASNSMLRNTIWALSNLCRGKPQPKMETVAPAIPVLAATLNSEDTEILVDCCWALSYLSDGDNERVEAVVQSNVVPRLVQLLSHASPTVVTPALRTIGNIVSGSDTQTQAVIDAGGLAACLPLLDHIKKGIRKEACWMLSNVAAGSSGQVSALLGNPQIMYSVVTQLKDAEWEVKKEAAWVLSNVATGGSQEQALSLVKNDERTIGAICGLLDVDDVKTVMVALDALEALLKYCNSSGGVLDVPHRVDECDGLESLEKLQEHENMDVYDKVVNIIETYFGGDENENDGVGTENVDPSASHDGKSFSFGIGGQSTALVQQNIQPFGQSNFQLR